MRCPVYVHVLSDNATLQSTEVMHCERMLLAVTGSRAQRTEDGSHASDSVHLAGIESTPTDHIVQLFCMKMTFPKESDYGWMPGSIADTDFVFQMLAAVRILSACVIVWLDDIIVMALDLLSGEVVCCSTPSHLTVR